MTTAIAQWTPTLSGSFHRRRPPVVAEAVDTLGCVTLFDRFRRKPQRDTPLTAASKRNRADLEEFLTSREGVEGFVEPPTSTYAMTLCLVASDGEALRRAIKNEAQAKKLCDEYDVPLYDARKVGYPQRMKDYQQGVRRDKVRLEDMPPLVADETADAPEAETDTDDDSGG